jgi:hypothetical protein
MDRGVRKTPRKGANAMVKHKISINIAKPDGTPSPVVRSGTMQIRKRILDFLFGQQVNVLVLSPGDSVQTVEIHELKGGENYDKRKQI